MRALNFEKMILIFHLFFSYLLENTLGTIFSLEAKRFIRQRDNAVQTRSTGPISQSDNQLNEILNFVGLVNRHGYPAEEHLVTTSDGYKVRIHRIPGSRTKPKIKGKPVVYMQHGILASSDTWVLMGPDHDLAYMLADAGFDVWLGNVRGNTYSRSHMVLSPDYNPEFWQFSFHEIALHDIAESISYILEVTEQESLVYIGHSMGTTMSYVLLSMKPEYNEKISLVISFAPVAFWHAPPRPFVRFLMDNMENIKTFIKNARIYEIFPLTAANARFAKAACTDQSPFKRVCHNMLYFISGYNPDQLNSTSLPFLISYMPAGSSTKTLLHFSQNLKSGDFHMYDYGLIKNLATYGQAKPPSYNLSNIVTPVVLMYGKGDVLVSPGNPDELAKRLPNVMAFEAVPDERFSHLDFLFAKDLKALLNDRVLRMIMNFVQRGIVF